MLFKHHLVFLSFPPLRWMMCAKAAASWATALLTVLDLPSFAPSPFDHLKRTNDWIHVSNRGIIYFYSLPGGRHLLPVSALPNLPWHSAAVGRQYSNEVRIIITYSQYCTQQYNLRQGGALTHFLHPPPLRPFINRFIN